MSSTLGCLESLRRQFYSDAWGPLRANPEANYMQNKWCLISPTRTGKYSFSMESLPSQTETSVNQNGHMDPDSGLHQQVVEGEEEDKDSNT